LKHMAELRHDTNRNIFKQFVDGISQVCFHRNTMAASPARSRTCST
jgi:hypothetical protein